MKTEEIKQRIEDIKDRFQDMDSMSWEDGKGVLLTGNEAIELLESNKELRALLERTLQFVDRYAIKDEILAALSKSQPKQ